MDSALHILSGCQCPVVRNMGPTTQIKKKSKLRNLLQQFGQHHGTYDTTIRQALSSKLKTHP
eukprot:1151546-Pelagomonas_calceolata.AAC.1